MNKIINVLRKPSRMVAIGALSAAALFTLLAYAGGFPRAFMPVMSNLFSLLLQLAIIGGILFCLLAKQDKLLGHFLPFVFAWWLLNITFNMLDGAWSAQEGREGLTIAIGVFDFILALILLASLVLLVLGRVKENELFRKIGFVALFGSLALQFLIMVLCLAECGVGDYPWNSYFAVFADLAVAVGFLFAYFPKAFGEGGPALQEEAPQAEPAPSHEEELLDEDSLVEEPQEEAAPEQPAEEQPQEEEPEADELEAEPQEDEPEAVPQESEE